MATRPSSSAQQGYNAAWRKMRARVLLRDRYRCAICGGPADTVDHITPLRDGGARLDPRNLRAVCRADNLELARQREQQIGRTRRPWQADYSRPRRVWPGAITLGNDH